jgi:transcriptional regulator GlxA family with amidase domain
MSEFRHRKAAMLGIAPRHAGFLVCPGFDLLQLSGPLEAFRLAGEFEAGGYRLSVMSLDGGEVESAAGLKLVTRPATCDGIDTLVVVGSCHGESFPPPGISDFVCAASASLVRIVGIGTGMLALAEAGLLEGRRAAISAELSAILQRAYSGILTNCERSFINDRGLWTAPGTAAGMELCLALIEEDLGREVACAVARVLPLHRTSKSQYSSPFDQLFESSAIHGVLGFAREHLDDPLPCEKLASIARVSPTELHRDFLSETGLTPAKAVERLRVEAARPKVQDGREPFETIARSVGFRNADEMRRGFLCIFGQPPQGMRRAARSARKAERRRRTPLPPVTNSRLAQLV